MEENIVGVGVAIYCRVSTQEQRDEGISLAAQEDRCRQRIESMTHLISPNVRVYRDAGYSGGMGYYKEGVKKNNYRPGLTSLLNDIANGSIKYWIVYRNDRTSRNLRLWLEILDDFIDKYHVQYISIVEPGDPLDPEGRMRAQMLGSAAEYQRRWTAANIADTMKYKRTQGYRVGAPPYGWMWSATIIDLWSVMSTRVRRLF